MASKYLKQIAVYRMFEKELLRLDAAARVNVYFSAIVRPRFKRFRNIFVNAKQDLHFSDSKFKNILNLIDFLDFFINTDKIIYKTMTCNCNFIN